MADPQAALMIPNTHPFRSEPEKDGAATAIGMSYTPLIPTNLDILIRGGVP
jgi:hypothetical protein